MCRVLCMIWLSRFCTKITIEPEVVMYKIAKSTVKILLKYSLYFQYFCYYTYSWPTLLDNGRYLTVYYALCRYGTTPERSAVNSLSDTLVLFEEEREVAAKLTAVLLQENLSVPAGHRVQTVNVTINWLQIVKPVSREWHNMDYNNGKWQLLFD